MTKFYILIGDKMNNYLKTLALAFTLTSFTFAIKNNNIFMDNIEISNQNWCNVWNAPGRIFAVPNPAEGVTADQLTKWIH